MSRLLCSRVLQPDTRVPRVRRARRSSWAARPGSARTITADDEAHLAGVDTRPTHAVELPVYYSWAFATGAGGDFQSLAMLLRARPLPPGIGIQPVDVGQSGLAVDIPAGTTVPLAGALQPVGASDGRLADPGSAGRAGRHALRPVLNAPAAVAAERDPLLAPPLYGARAGAARPSSTRHASALVRAAQPRARAIVPSRTSARASCRSSRKR